MKIELNTAGIIGRSEEIRKFRNVIESDKSEFVAVYGRRRVGKTFLVKELFKDCFTFRFSGRENASVGVQLENFNLALNDFCNEIFPKPDSWSMAFHQLEKFIEKQCDGPKVIFLDELPWLDTPKSGFLGALEYFWNNWAFYRDDIKLIVCGSATSWMLNKLINSRGGLHNRVTHRMLISPFTLKETEYYFKSKGFAYERPEILDCYMVFGGVAYYLSLFEKDKSVAENTDYLCFSRSGELHGEFRRLFSSLFKTSKKHEEIIAALSQKGVGMTRQEIADATKLINNGNLTNMLVELEECEFIRSYTPFGKTKKEKLYQLVDLYTLFHYHFLQSKNDNAKNYWLKILGKPKHATWCGFAFEKVCLHHLDNIVGALGIAGMQSDPCSWIYKADKTNEDEMLQQGAQIDLLIDRSDKVINICEMKYSNNEYEITKAYDQQVFRRMEIFRKVAKTRKTLVPVYITPFGLLNNAYSRKVMNSITLDDLF